MLDHYHRFSVMNTYNVLHFVYKDLSITKPSVRRMLDGASKDMHCGIPEDFYGKRLQGVAVPYLVLM